MRLINIFIIISLLLSGCATANKMNKVQIGMTKSEVIKTIGNPASVSAKDESEYLNYLLSETDDQAWDGITVPYYVRLINGRVDSYGRLGDFDSTQKPTIKIETDENIKTQTEVKSSGKEDLYSELMKLKQLKEEGLITQEEFEKEKKELLDKY
jgi:outer membrane protein assembly factor BamE (lipoprotein component of BamABCDE complex)